MIDKKKLKKKLKELIQYIDTKHNTRLESKLLLQAAIDTLNTEITCNVYEKLIEEYK